MGLEITDMIMEIEYAFGIEIPEDADIEPRVSAVVDYVYKHLKSKDGQTCYSSYCFYQLRTAICEISDIERKQIRPSTEIRSVLDMEKDKAIYPKLIQKLGVLSKGLPEKSFHFILHDNFKNPFSLLIGIFCAGLFFFTILGPIPFLYGIPLFSTGLFLFYLSELICGNRLINWPACCLQNRYDTFGDAARSMINHTNLANITGKAPLYSKEQLNQIIKEIISDIIFEPIDKIADDAHLVNDLGMG